MKALPGRLIAAAVGLQAGFTGLLVMSPLRYSVVAAIGLLVGSLAVYLMAAAAVVKLSQSANPPQISGLHRWMIGVALLLRLTAAWIPPDFSDDLYRYRWEARLQAEGGNPYLAAPNDATWARLRDAEFGRIPGRDFRAVYGPFTELVYRMVYQAGGHSVWWMKVPGALGDLGVMAGLWLLLPLVGVPRERWLIYGWCPVPVFEFWANGHNDTLMLCPLVFAFAARARGRLPEAFLWLGMAVSAKIWPVALAPVVGLSAWALLAPAVVAMWMAPFGLAPFTNGPFLSGFLGGWRNNDSVYGLLLWATGDQYRAKYMAFAIVAAVIVWVALRREAAVRGALMVVSAMLLVSSNCHPWYLTWLLPWLAVYPEPALLVWIALSPIFYVVLPRWFEAGEWNGSTAWRWVVYVPVLVVFLWTHRGALNRDAPRI